MNNDWKKKTETLLNRAWSRGTNWAIKGFGYSMDTDVEAEIDEVNNLIQSLLDKQKQEERNRITQICEEVRDECRESDDQWDKGDECKRIKNKLTNT